MEGRDEDRNTAPRAGIEALLPGGELPEHARCGQCGYRLRGLREPRCPECGTAFDPAKIRNAFIAQWPRLLLWVLIGQVAPALLMIPFALPLLIRDYPR